KIHGKFGAEAKPLACRVYPFVLVPAGHEWRVGLRYACPSAADGKGRPLAEHAAELRQYAAALQTQEQIGADVPAPPLQEGQPAPWADVARFTEALRRLVAEPADPLERRLRKCLALADLCRQAKFDTVSGRRLGEFLELVTAGLEAEVPSGPGARA